MRVKILDAWARGLAVVATTIGAEGLQYRPGEDILIADTPADFAAAVLAILSDAPLARRLAAAGRATVEQHYDWRSIYPAWDEVYEVR
jgi:glycosyltransferase involved in cell wall biosynthesis